VAFLNVSVKIVNQKIMFCRFVRAININQAMHISKFSPFLVIVLFTSLFASAQKTQQPPAKKPQPTITKVKPFKTPKLQTSLDVYKDSVKINASEAVRIIALPLKIYDDKKNEYSISSYQFLYKKTGFKVDDEKDENAKQTPVTSISSDRFKTTPLPDLWVNLIKQDVKTGEEFYFFDVIAKDAQGRVMYAPNLKILIR
jgi:hypothetical protein